MSGEKILDLKALRKYAPLPLPIREFLDFLLRTKLGLMKIQYFLVSNEYVPFLRSFLRNFLRKM